MLLRLRLSVTIMDTMITLVSRVTHKLKVNITLCLRVAMLVQT